MGSACRGNSLLEQRVDVKQNMDFFRKLFKSNPDKEGSPEVDFKRYQERKLYTLDEALMLEYKIDKAYEVV